jgi:hypothetical protein
MEKVYIAIKINSEGAFRWFNIQSVTTVQNTGNQIVTEISHVPNVSKKRFVYFQYSRLKIFLLELWKSVRLNSKITFGSINITA